ncbi:hypothetical protein J1N35_034430 [Gossypium stocksii]|uniref:Uncharacterized protein n=1 Tax=Gossypium stocksii TaxID=47602 RepID=A0A9D3ZQP6_9ROSI|nr:hypothetical protein J1N35_034430 [Gossypium stocksii]
MYSSKKIGGVLDADRNFSILKHGGRWRAHLNGRRINIIKVLEDNTRRKVSIVEEMEVVARGFFQNLFATNGIGDLEHILPRVDRCITNYLKMMLTASYPKEENFMALKGVSNEGKKLECMNEISIMLIPKGLSTLMRLALNDGMIKREKASKRGPQISHLLFANDYVMFG